MFVEQVYGVQEDHGETRKKLQRELADLKYRQYVRLVSSTAVASATLVHSIRQSEISDVWEHASLSCSISWKIERGYSAASRCLLDVHCDEILIEDSSTVDVSLMAADLWDVQLQHLGYRQQELSQCLFWCVPLSTLDCWCQAKHYGSDKGATITEDDDFD